MPGVEGEVVRFALLSLPSRNSSNKCTFHTKVSLLVLPLSLDPPPVGCKLKVCVIPKPFYCKCPAVKMASNWVPVYSVCMAAAHVPLPIVKLASIYFCLYDCHGDWGSSESELVTPWFYTHSLDREFARGCELWVVSALLVLLKAGFIPHLLDTHTRENIDCAGKRLYPWQTWSIKIRLSPTTFLVTQDPRSQNSICSSCREQTALSLHSTLGEGRIYG